MKNIYKLLFVFFFLGIATYGQEDEEETTQDETTETETTEDEDVENEELPVLVQPELKQYRTNILGSVLVQFNGEPVNLNKHTFIDSETVNPEFIVDWCVSVHDLSEKSFSYGQKHKDFCKTIKRKDLDRLLEEGVHWQEEEWEEEQIENLNKRLNVRDREVRQKLEELKAKKQAKRAKEKAKREKKRLKELNKKYKKANKKIAKVKKEDVEEMEQEREAEVPSPDVEMVKLIDEDVLEDQLVLKVSEPIFTKNEKKAIILVTKTDKNIVSSSILVLSKSSGERWCIKGEIEIEKAPFDKSKLVKRKEIVKEFEDDGVNFVDGKKVHEIGEKKEGEKEKTEEGKEGDETEKAEKSDSEEEKGAKPKNEDETKTDKIKKESDSDKQKESEEIQEK